MRNPPSRNGLRAAAGVCGLIALALVASAPDAFAQGGLVPRPIEATSLARDAFATGTLTRETGALPADLWKGAGATTIDSLLDALPARPAGPALGEALRRTLLTPGDAPAAAAAGLGGKKLLALVRAGFSEPARTIASLSNVAPGDPTIAPALALADLLDGKLDDACQRNAALASGREAPFWVRLRVVCYAARGEREAAELTLSLLREQGALSDADETLFSALVAGSAPKTPPAPENAFHLAAWRLLKLPLAPASLRAADGGVLKAVAADAAFDPSTRAEAAILAADAGVASRLELVEIYKSLPAPAAASSSRRSTDDAYAHVLAWRAAQAMVEPAQLRDRAAKTAAEIGDAKSRAALRAAALVYADDLQAFDGVLLAPADYARFALARLALGDASGAARWLGQMPPPAGAAPLGETDKKEFIELVSLLSILDPKAGKALADAAGVAPRAVLDDAPTGLGPIAPTLPDLVEAAFDAAVKGSKGQAALAALAAAAATGPNDAVGRVVVAQSLRAAGLEAIRNRMMLDQALALRFEDRRLLSPRPQAAPGLVKTGAAANAPPPPRAKPAAKPPTGKAASGTAARPAKPAAPPKPRN